MAESNIAGVADVGGCTMRTPCAFQWYECVDRGAIAQQRCKLQDAGLPRWAKVHLAESCPYRGEQMSAREVDGFLAGDWRWTGQ